MPDLLLEIGCEEIPARMIDGAREEFARRVGDLLARERLGAKAGVQAFSTPRRLAVIATEIARSQPDVKEQLQGPAIKMAFKDGQPTAAAEAFAKKVGTDVSKLQKVSTPKGEYLSASVSKKGRSATEVLAEILPKEIAAIYWPKSMYWQGKNGQRFIRPVRWLVAILDGKTIPVEFAGIAAGAESHGHRTLSAEAVLIHEPERYAEELLKASVVADPAEREQRIRKALDAATRTVSGAGWREDKALLHTVINLTEFPSAILGGFEREYLQLPEEVLITVMRDHQKYFAVEDGAEKLAPYFLAVLNTEGDPEGIIRHGHERVLRARFNDARFFWQADQKIPLRERVELLKKVTFQKDLGSYYEKTERVTKLADELAANLENSGVKLNRNAVREAAWLAKTDLTTELVKEFTELQGIVGGLYARAQGLEEKIAAAIYDHYKPESVENAVPRTIEGAILSIADKAGSIAGMFALGLQPTGSKDPLALRRQANGIVKTIAEHRLRINLGSLLELAIRSYPQAALNKTKIIASISLFLQERLEFYLRDVLGFAYDTARAVMASSADPNDVVQTIERARAVSTLRSSADFEHISVAFKRIKNILRQARLAGWVDTAGFHSEGLEEEPEKLLAAQIPRVSELVEEMRARGDYRAALLEISKLRPSIDSFFDKVMVMAPDKNLRENRLALLSAILKGFSTIADFSEIVTEGKEEKEKGIS